ncbi:MAG: Gldg family protein [Desulfobacterales bacterium]|nr:Gldg family protein [Desulfobacterales bacterium]
MAVEKRSGKIFKLITYLVAVILVNAVAVSLYTRIDLTENKIFSISEVSKTVVSSISEPLTIKVFFTKNLPAPYNNTERYLRDILEAYSLHANRFFNYEFYDVSPEEDGLTEAAEENRRLAMNYGINPVQIQHVEKDEIKFRKGFMGLVMIHGDIVERIPTISSSKGLEYRLTTAIQKLSNKTSALLTLSEKIKVTLVLSSSINSVSSFMGIENMPDMPKIVEETVARLNEKSYDQIEYHFIDPTKEQNISEIKNSYNVMVLEWPELKEAFVPAGEGLIGIVMEYEDKIVEIPLLNVIEIPMFGTQYELVSPETLESVLNNNLEVMININDSLGYLADGGTLPLTVEPSPENPNPMDEMGVFRNLMSSRYTVEEVRLNDENVGDNIRCLVISKPTKPFTEYELFQLDQLLMKGKNLAIFFDSYNELPFDPQRMMMSRFGPEMEKVDTGLKKLLEHYGIKIQQSYVLDENCFEQKMPDNMGGGEQPIYFAPVIKSDNINNNLDYMHNIKGLIVMRASPLELDEVRLKENNIKATLLFSSSEKAWEMKDAIILNPRFIRKPENIEEQYKSMPLAYMLEGEFTSYFAGKTIPGKVLQDPGISEDQNTEKTDGKDLSVIEKSGSFIEKGRPAKIFVVSSAEMVKSNMLDAKGETVNSMFMLNIIDTLNNQEKIAEMRTKEQTFNPLDESAALTKTFVKTFNIIGLPLLVVVFGLFVWGNRHLKRKRIQAIYNK